jgi:hypothetical protein
MLIHEWRKTKLYMSVFLGVELKEEIDVQFANVERENTTYVDHPKIIGTSVAYRKNKSRPCSQMSLISSILDHPKIIHEYRTVFPTKNGGKPNYICRFSCKDEIDVEFANVARENTYVDHPKITHENKTVFSLFLLG